MLRKLVPLMIVMTFAMTASPAHAAGNQDNFIVPVLMVADVGDLTSYIAANGPECAPPPQTAMNFTFTGQFRAEHNVIDQDSDIHVETRVIDDSDDPACGVFVGSVCAKIELDAVRRAVQPPATISTTTNPYADSQCENIRLGDGEAFAEIDVNGWAWQLPSVSSFTSRHWWTVEMGWKPYVGTSTQVRYYPTPGTVKQMTCDLVWPAEVEARCHTTGTY